MAVEQLPYALKFARPLPIRATLHQYGWALAVLTALLGGGVTTVLGLYVLFRLLDGIFFLNQEQREQSEATLRRSASQQLRYAPPSTDWLNSVLAMVWYKYNTPTINAEWAEWVRSNLDYYRPDAVSALQVESLDFGQSPPIITGCRAAASPLSKHELYVDLDLYYFSNARLKLNLKLGRKLVSMWVPVELCDLMFRAKLRMILTTKPHSERIFSRISFSLLERPTIGNLSINVLTHLPMSEVPVVKSWLRRLVTESWLDYYVSPDHQLWDLDAGVFVWEENGVRLHEDAMSVDGGRHEVETAQAAMERALQEWGQSVATGSAPSAAPEAQALHKAEAAAAATVSEHGPDQPAPRPAGEEQLAATAATPLTSPSDLATATSESAGKPEPAARVPSKPPHHRRGVSVDSARIQAEDRASTADEGQAPRPPSISLGALLRGTRVGSARSSSNSPHQTPQSVSEGGEPAVSPSVVIDDSMHIGPADIAVQLEQLEQHHVTPLIAAVRRLTKRRGSSSSLRATLSSTLSSLSLLSSSSTAAATPTSPDAASDGSTDAGTPRHRRSGSSDTSGGGGGGGGGDDSGAMDQIHDHIRILEQRLSRVDADLDKLQASAKSRPMDRFRMASEARELKKLRARVDALTASSRKYTAEFRRLSFAAAGGGGGARSSSSTVSTVSPRSAGEAVLSSSPTPTSVPDVAAAASGAAGKSSTPTNGIGHHGDGGDGDGDGDGGDGDGDDDDAVADAAGDATAAAGNDAVDGVPSL